MLLHFDFESETPTWREFQRALERIAGRTVSMTGGPGPSGEPEVWSAKVGGLKGTLRFEFQAAPVGGLTIHASEAHGQFVAPLVGVFAGKRRSPRIEARSDTGTLDYSNGPNPYDCEWFEFSGKDGCFKLEIGYLYLLFGEETERVRQELREFGERVMELDADESGQTLVIHPTDLLELRSALDAADIEAPADIFLAEDLDCCREDFKDWLEAQHRANAAVTVTRHY